ncbi:hypothetical protein A2125_02050 [Candidatus Woesebacteria bacterium GWB1_43_5]|uniref:ATP-grasp domain-containing protein n=1 Tax=Candidatus Woesebacteria bacterium GWB1_43_5 TaxID=1802474 RepID=A0A1F7WRY5_9BACT|nr:MAG: hypothetical protein A2125_02050 [Candidatus Woesebacteria bacterium GWB1_43_5]
MKKILFLTDKSGSYIQSMVKYLEKKLDNTEVIVDIFSNLKFEVDGKNIKVWVSDVNIEEFNLVYLRRADHTLFSVAGTLADCLEYLGIAYFDTTFRNIGPAGDKFTAHVRLSIAGLPTIPSIFCWRDKIEKYSDDMIAKFGLPIVAKEFATQRGKGVLLIKKKADFKKLLERKRKDRDEQFLFQKFIKNDEEYRILVLKNTIGAYERKVRTDPNEFRSNVALGAREEFIDVDKIPEDHKKIAFSAAQTLNIEVAGVDLMIDSEEGRPWLVEVNRGPGLTLDVNVSPELQNLASFLKKELGKND